MARNWEGDIDEFAKGIEALLGDIPNATGKEMDKAVTQSVRKTAKELRGERTAGIGRHPWSEDYRGGFSSRVDKNWPVITGEVGNKSKPGLVHLLEKGHVTLTERRTQAFPHMAPAFDDMQEDFVERASKALGRAIS